MRYIVLTYLIVLLPMIVFSQNESFLGDTAKVKSTYTGDYTFNDDINIWLSDEVNMFENWIVYFDSNRTKVAYKSYFVEDKFVTEENWKSEKIRRRESYLDTTKLGYVGCPTLVEVYCENGQLIQSLIYNTKETQHIIAYYCNGNKKVDQNFTIYAKYGVVGNFKYWHENGILKFDTNYDNEGNKIGEWKYWKEDGTLEKTEFYEKDKLIETKNIFYFLQEKKEIPISFMKDHTQIDSIYYHDGVEFIGDTVYLMNDKYNVGIVNYSDGLVCSIQFILIIDSKNYANTSYIIGSTDCDRDGDSEYYYYSFVIESGKIVITENKVAKGQEMENATIVETIEYTIDESGKLLPRH